MILKAEGQKREEVISIRSGPLTAHFLTFVAGEDLANQDWNRKDLVSFAGRFESLMGGSVIRKIFDFKNFLRRNQFNFYRKVI